MWPFHWFSRRKSAQAPIDEELWRQALSDHPVLRGLSSTERARLRELAGGFLAEKIFEPAANGLQLHPAMKLSVALQASLPILELGAKWYAGWRTVILYPAEFVSPREQVDHAGVTHQWKEVLGGETSQRGPVVLSWADVEASGWGDGYNVVIHEMAHKLDMLNGGVDGFPPLHRNMKVSEWTRAWTDVFEGLNRQLDQGLEPVIDPYAAENPGECFAVFSEYFFEQPGMIRSQYPAVYGQLCQFYRQDPASRRRS